MDCVRQKCISHMVTGESYEWLICLQRDLLRDVILRTYVRSKNQSEVGYLPCCPD
jgi:hypothetical protein